MTHETFETLRIRMKNYEAELYNLHAMIQEDKDFPGGHPWTDFRRAISRVRFAYAAVDAWVAAEVRFGR